MFRRKQSSGGAVESAASLSKVNVFRDFVEIRGHVCSLTIGRLCLLIADGSPLFCEGLLPIEEDDVLRAFFFVVDDNLPYIVQGGDVLQRRYNRWYDGLSTRERCHIVQQFMVWAQDISELLPDSPAYDDPGEDGGRVRDSAWIDVVDKVASQYSWTEQFILWELPLYRAVRYAEAIDARLAGERRVEDISDDAIAMLDKQEREHNGES